MKPFACLVLASLLVNPAPAAISAQSQEASAPQKVTAGKDQPSNTPPKRKEAPSFAFGLEEGTPVKLKLSRDLSSATDTTGDKVDFEVSEDVSVQDKVVIPKGGIAWGTVVEAQHKRRLGRAGKLDVKIDEVRLADGERVPLAAVRNAQGKGRQGPMTGAIIASGILFFPAAPLFLFIHGKDITIPKGTEVTAYVSGDIALDGEKFAKQ
jgi:hypothetical protein